VTVNASTGKATAADDQDIDHDASGPGGDDAHED
jgi:hypothetical protein